MNFKLRLGLGLSIAITGIAIGLMIENFILSFGTALGFAALSALVMPFDDQL